MSDNVREHTGHEFGLWNLGILRLEKRGCFFYGLVVQHDDSHIGDPEKEPSGVYELTAAGED